MPDRVKQLTYFFGKLMKMYLRVLGGIDRNEGIPRKKLNFCHSSKFRQLKNVYTFSKLKHMQWRIQDFPGMDANLLFGIIFGENRIKMKKKIGRGGGRIPRGSKIRH